jgi:hypothetical protein
MAPALSTDQLQQIINNTMLVILVRPDLQEDWHNNLVDLLDQARSQALEDEAIFVAAVLTLIYSPDDTLPTGTVYDRAWQTLLSALHSGVSQGTEDADPEMTLERLLKSVAEAVVTVQLRAPSQVEALLAELQEVHRAASEAQVEELIRWLDDVIALVNGAPLESLGAGHSGVYGRYWGAIVDALQGGAA